MKGCFEFMDTVKIGRFIAELRREKNLTQEELGERLGVTNKTVSRWENGNYMPNIEMLQLLSAEFGVSVNELLCGEKIDDGSYRRKADENIVSVIGEQEQSRFTLKERCDFWRNKWKREHLAEMIICCVIAAVVCIISMWLKKYIIAAAGCVFAVCFCLKKRNQMMAYIEQHAFDGSGK